MLSIWIIHRDPSDRAAIARISGVDERAVLAAPGDPVLDAAEAPTVVVLGLSGDFELELDFVHRHASKLDGCSWILMPKSGDADEARRLFDTLPAEVLAYPPDPRALRRALRAAVQHRAADPLSARQGRAELQARFTRWLGDVELPELMRALDPRLSRVPLLIHGEEGTGRGLLARYVHVFAGRAEHDLVHVTCRRDARAEDLLRQMAQGAAPGRGDVLTFYFEDVDRLPAAVQRRVRDWIEFGLPDGAMRRHGHRFMASASSAADLDREPGLDPRLAETLSGLTIALPPLRERRGHVAAFVQQTAGAFAVAQGARTRRFSDAALEKLAAYPWPGNLHELEAVVVRTLSFTSADPVEPLHLRFPSDLQWLEEPVARADLEPEAVHADLPEAELVDEAEETQDETAEAAEEGVAKLGGPPAAAPALEEENEEADASAPTLEPLGDLDPGAAPGHEDDLDVGRVASLGQPPISESEAYTLGDEEPGAAAYTLSDEEEESLFPDDELEDDDEALLPEAELLDPVPVSQTRLTGRAETGAHGELMAEVELIEDPEISATLVSLDDPADVHEDEVRPEIEATPPPVPTPPRVETEELLPELSPLDPPVRPLPEADEGAPSAESLALGALPFDPETAPPIDGPLEPHATAPAPGDAPTDPKLQSLVGAIAHEVRNPLVSIRTFSELLPDHYDDPEFRTHFRELVVKDVERIDRVISRLQALAEGSGKSEPVDVARMLDRLLDERRSTIQSRRLLVLKELDHVHPMVHADPDQLRDALAGLLDRAIDQASERGDVYLASKHNARGPDGHATVRVLIRHTRASSGEAPASGVESAQVMLDLVLAERLLEAQGARLTVDEAEANESVIVVDLPAA